MLATRKRKIILALFLLFMLTFAVYLGMGIVRSLYLESSHITLALPARGAFSTTIRIAQVSDLHRAVFGENNQELVDLVASKRPDIIVATGDMIDKRIPDIQPTIDLFKRFLDIAPVVFSLGNHEVEHENLEALLVSLDEIGVQIVNNSTVTVGLNGVEFTIGGVYYAQRLDGLVAESGSIDVLLCHFPDKIDFFAHYGVPLIFCGHTHGGQFRIPIVNIAMYAPGQGFFPEYTKGLYTVGDTHMIVSRGLGNSSFPFRVYNPPEVVIADITYSQ